MGVPYLIAGVAIACIGAGLLCTISISTLTVQWAAFMVVTGTGIGIAQQLPYTAIQAVLQPEDVATGNAIAVFSSQLGGALALAIAQNLLINKLGTSVARHTDVVPPEYVIAAGVSGLRSLTTSPEVLLALRKAYSESVRYTFILAVAALCFAFLPSCAMERVNIKQVAE